MNFNSVSYYIFLPTTLFLYFALPTKARNAFLLAASYFFYMCWEPVYAVLIFTSTITTYAFALLLERRALNRRRLWLALSLSINLFILFFFKYYNFAVDLLLSGFSLFQIQINLPLSNLLLPVGISFYTFQVIGYTADVYNGKINTEKNFIDYALFVSFFPQLVAGPIERAKNLMPQIKHVQTFSIQRVFEGMVFILWGLFKKIVIADRLAIMVNTAFDMNPSELGGFPLAVAAAAFSIQIYCDFSAYSDIARGTARMLGISLMRNFDAPYLAASIKDFWRRWHISLSTWFKDYVYFPLGGSRCESTRRVYLNVMIVFLVSGLWHGASLTFLAWGFLHGIFQIMSVASRPLKEKLSAVVKINAESLPVYSLRVLFNFALVTLAFVFFRASTISYALLFLKEMAVSPLSGSISQLGVSAHNLAAVVVAVIILFIVDAVSRKTDLVKRIAERFILKYAVYFALLTATLIFGCYGDGFNPQEFIYFQF